MRFHEFAAWVILALSMPTQVGAQTRAQAPRRPTLIVVVVVDQFSADLFQRYRATYRGGLARMAGGVAFPNGYQSHAATETCPGHSTILTGYRPGHTGIIANDWIDQSVARADKTVYCMEDPRVPGSTSTAYMQSLQMLRVATLGDRLKAADAGSRTIGVSGKDRGAMLLAGSRADATWWFGGRSFATYAGRPGVPEVDRANAALGSAIARAHAPYAAPAQCTAAARDVALPSGRSVGSGRFARAAGDAKAFAVSPELDDATLDLASAAIAANRLGRRGHTDLIGISLSATDRIGHAFGAGGAEMCIQIAELDTRLGAFFDGLDTAGIDYLAVLTADHGGLDLTERTQENGIRDAERVDPALTLGPLNAALNRATRIDGPLILGGGPSGDMYLRRDLTQRERNRVSAAALALWRGHRQVAAVFAHDEIAHAPEPSGPPESWSLLNEAKAGFDPKRSGDFIVLLKPRVSAIARPGTGSVAGHSSPWIYDRRVPILFWRRGLVPFEQPLGIETVDIVPTIAAQIGLPITGAPLDGRCIDIDAGPTTLCP